MPSSVDASTDDTRPARGFVWLLVAITVVAGFLRFRQLNRFSYWLDEILQTYFIHGTWTQFWESLRFDVTHPPLDYLIDRLLEFLDPADWVRKLLPALWGTLTVPVLALFVARRAGRAAGLAAALLLAVAPFHVRYSQELRPYALAMLLVIVSLLALDRFLERPGARRGVVLYLAFLATAYSLYLGAVALALGAAAIVVEDALSAPGERRRTARRALAWSPVFAALLVAGYWPWIPIVRAAVRSVADSAPPPMTLSRYTSLFAFYSTASGEGQAFRPRDLLFAAAVVAGALVASRRPGCRWLLAWFALTAVATEALEQLHPHYPVPRHFLPAGLALVALAGVGIGALELARRPWGCAVPLLLGAMVVPALRGLSEYYEAGRPDWRPVARHIRSLSNGGRVVVENQWLQLCLAFYLDGPSWLHRPLPVPYEVIALPNGDPTPFAWLWKPGQPLLVVTCMCGGQSPRVKGFVHRFPAVPFPQAEWATVYLLPNRPQ